MSCEKHKHHLALCPCAFGLALGLTSALAILLWSMWMMHYGAPQAMSGHVMMPSNAGEVIAWMGIALLKGFVFGFILVFLYNCITGHKRCKKCCGDQGSCGTSSCK